MKKVLSGALLVLLAGAAFVFFQTQNSRQKNQPSITQETDLKTTITEIEPKCSGKAIPQLTEGPYYAPNSPERRNIIDGAVGERLTLQGYVFDTDCKPIANAWIDFWQADGEGNYDNDGYRLRGHQYTDENGYYSLETVTPTRYTGRTEHIHFKIRATEQSPVITSQLFFPNSQTNETDTIFDESLVVTMGEPTSHATYNFVINN